MRFFLKYFVLGAFWFCSVSAMEVRHALKLDSMCPESPSIHAYNGFSGYFVYNTKLLSESELKDQLLKPEAQDLKCDVVVNIAKFKEIFEISTSQINPEFYITVLRSSSVIDDPFSESNFHDPLFRPHYAYYDSQTIGVGKANNFRKTYGITCFSFVDAYCKTRTCYIDDQTKKSTFANQCWNASQQNFSIHTDNLGNVVLSGTTPTIDTVKTNANANKSCAVFYASKLPAGLSQSKREIYGLIMILNDKDMAIFKNNFDSNGLSYALSNDSILSRSNTALEIFPNLWK